jgi:hypothetical protein
MVSGFKYAVAVTVLFAAELNWYETGVAGIVTVPVEAKTVKA